MFETPGRIGPLLQECMYVCVLINELTGYRKKALSSSGKSSYWSVLFCPICSLAVQSTCSNPCLDDNMKLSSKDEFPLNG